MDMARLPNLEEASGVPLGKGPLTDNLLDFLEGMANDTMNSAPLIG
jgi:hypothetical protein